MLLGYTGAVNAAVNVSESEIDTKILKIANPDYILYDDDATLQFIKNDSDLKGLKAVKNKQTLMISQEEISRMGTTSLFTLNKIMNFMYPDRLKKIRTQPPNRLFRQPLRVQQQLQNRHQIHRQLRRLQQLPQMQTVRLKANTK